MVLRQWFGVISMALLLGASSGCARYKPLPLQPNDTLRDVDRARCLAEHDEASSQVKAGETLPPPFTFARAAELMKTHSPELKEVQAEYETALALAKVKTPLPNPSLEAGPNYGSGTSVEVNRLMPFGSLGFAFPTGGRLKRQDEVNRLRAEQAHIEALVRHRELYLELRQNYSRLLLAQQRLALRKSIAESAEKSATLTERLVEHGNVTALDTALMELEAARLKAETLSSETEIVTAEREMSRLIGVNAGKFGAMSPDPLPKLPESVPKYELLRESLVTNHPQLARLRAGYEVADRELRLEIARQYPDFRLGPSAEPEVGEKKIVLGLTLGIDLPVFDRNQQAIAQAEKKREEARVKYGAAANRALADLEQAWRALGLALEKERLIRGTVLPKAQANLDLVRKSLQAGKMDSLRVLEAERTERSLEVEALEAELSSREAWTVLEQAVGYPLVPFPTEQLEFRPASSEQLQKVVESSRDRRDPEAQRTEEPGPEVKPGN